MVRTLLVSACVGLCIGSCFCPAVTEIRLSYHSKRSEFAAGLHVCAIRGKKNDAYVICRVSDDVFKRTETIDEGGRNPTWNEGKGEEMLFEVDAAETAGMIRLECMDNDSDEIVKKTGDTKEDDLIGLAVCATVCFLRLENRRMECSCDSDCLSSRLVLTLAFCRFSTVHLDAGTEIRQCTSWEKMEA